jgi:hypothetical protein
MTIGLVGAASVLMVAVVGCGSGGAITQPIVAAADAPFVAGEHHDVRAFCDAYTPQPAHELVLERQPRIAGDCEAAMRAFVDSERVGSLYQRGLADQLVTDVAIRGDHATARISSRSAGGGYTMRFAKTPDGDWKIAGQSRSASLTVIGGVLPVCKVPTAERAAASLPTNAKPGQIAALCTKPRSSHG